MRKSDSRYDMVIGFPAQGGIGTKGRIIEAIQRKQEGAPKGFPDVLILEPIVGRTTANVSFWHHGAVRELKVGKDTMRPLQNWWRVELGKRCYHAQVCRSFEELKQSTIDYFEGRV